MRELIKNKAIKRLLAEERNNGDTRQRGIMITAPTIAESTAIL